jgi:hypothetical protein
MARPETELGLLRQLKGQNRRRAGTATKDHEDRQWQPQPGIVAEPTDIGIRNIEGETPERFASAARHIHT